MAKEIIEWDLSDLYTSVDDPQIENNMDEILILTENFKNTVKGKIIQGDISAQQIKEWYEKYEEIMEKVFYLSLFSALLYSTNSLDDKTRALKSKIDDFEAKIEEETLFFELELNEIPKEKYTELLNSPLLKNYRNTLIFNRTKKNHQLTEREEQIIVMKNLTGVKGYSKLYNELTSEFIYTFEVEGEKKSLTGAELFSFMHNPNPEIRRRALQTYLSKYRESELILTHIYNNVLKDWDLECKKRNFKEPISRRNLENEIDDEIVEILGKITTSSYNIVERYYNLKKKLLNLEELRMSDLYAPVGKISKKYSFDEAINLIKEINEAFHPKFREIVDEMYRRRHIDVTPRKGKIGGAFCSYGKQKKFPFVFVNFTENIESVLTLSHELGHAIHHYFIQQNQTMINIDSSLAVAEIASVFNEILTFDYLMKQNLTKEEKIALLCNHIEGNFATSHRQNAFYQFEKRIHELMKTKLPTSQDYKEIFIEEMEKMFGNSMNKIKEDYDAYCFIVSHFINVPFYVYAYNMANLLVIALYQLYLEQKDEFKPKFLKLLTVGHSLKPEEMLEEVGINIRDPSFWKKGIKYLTMQIEKLEKLMQS
ncbi:MAG: M3 family oligoendopeptidase [Candidatus Heimdallarchaeaceae archaeon]